MSRIGRQPIDVPAGVTVTVDPGRVTVRGPKGELRQEVPPRMAIEQRDGTIVVSRPTDRGPDRALHGLTRTIVANMVEGVTKGFEKRLEIQGVGYRAAVWPTACLSIPRTTTCVGVGTSNSMPGRGVMLTGWE